MRYFPLRSARFEHQFGVQAIPPGQSIVEATEHYHAEIAAIRRQLRDAPDDYFQASPDSRQAQQEAAETLLSSTGFLHNLFNAKLDEAIDLPGESALLEIGRHVQEDLILLQSDPEGRFPMIAGKVCFPSGWDVGSKLGQSFMNIHAPVPEFAEAMGEQSLRLLSRLKPDRPVWRTNWGVRPSPQLEQSTRHLPRLADLAAGMTAARVGQQCTMRVERQTLVRLPRTGAILFTIHTHQTSLDELSPIEQANLLGTIRTCPTTTLAYKGILPMREALERYLQDRCNSSVGG